MQRGSFGVLNIKEKLRRLKAETRVSGECVLSQNTLAYSRFFLPQSSKLSFLDEQFATLAAMPVLCDNNFTQTFTRIR